VWKVAVTVATEALVDVFHRVRHRSDSIRLAPVPMQLIAYELDAGLVIAVENDQISSLVIERSWHEALLSPLETCTGAYEDESARGIQLTLLERRDCVGLLA
jgi:hypothetical protein